MGLKYICFTDGQTYDNDEAVCSGFIFVGDGERYGSETLFCPDHVPTGDANYEAIPNFDLTDYPSE